MYLLRHNNKTHVREDRYGKSCIVAKFIDKDMIDPLDAIYNILVIMNNKIDKLEK